ncbi:MAG: hypothetical protein K2X29_09565 [Candidatus Obscuribacterales bacterium]|nr:hypothetical protein [Candidatus Obscuribacterales bacterium]
MISKPSLTTTLATTAALSALCGHYCTHSPGWTIGSVVFGVAFMNYVLLSESKRKSLVVILPMLLSYAAVSLLPQTLVIGSMTMAECKVGLSSVFNAGVYGAFSAAILFIVCMILKDAFLDAVRETYSTQQEPKEQQGSEQTQTNASKPELSKDRQVELARTIHAANDEGAFDAYEDALAKYHQYTWFNPDYDTRLANHIKKDTKRLGIDEKKDKERFDLYRNTYKETYANRWKYYEEYFGAQH